MSAQTSFISTDLDEIRADQARLLKKNALQSCFIVSGVSIFYAIWISFAGNWIYALSFAAAANLMVLVSFVHSRLAVRGDIIHSNYREYLYSHILVCSVTGMVWGAFAIGLIDFESSISLFIACFLSTSITLGGILPSSEYRPGFISLATFNLIPLAIYILFNGYGPQRLIGVGILIYFAFCMYASARSELDTREGITARNMKALTEQLVEKNAIIEKASAEKNRFLAATSHDLSQPLHAQGLLIHALKKKVSAEEQRDLLSRIEQTWRSQQQILQGLVDITRIDNGVIVPKQRQIDLRKHLKRLAEEMAEPARHAQILMSSDLESAIVYTDPVLMIRIVRNLLTNAIKFTPAGGRVTLTSKIIDTDVHILITDTGPGIPKDSHEKIFEEFVQLQTGAKDGKKGLGLGLSIVQRLSALLGLTVGLNSAAGDGTEFRIELPLSDTDHTPAAVHASYGHRINGSPLVVVIDNEQSIRESMQMLLTEWGCEVLLASGKADAVKRLSEISATPNMLLVDRQLDDNQDGVCLINFLREELNEDVPAILITGDLSGASLRVQDEKFRVLPKPIDPSVLYDAIMDAF